jgi:UDP-N-acetylmuramate--alanine ligase
MNEGAQVHCIGIGGIGLSGLAQILHAKGNLVTGSDMHASHLTESMQKKGIEIFIGHDESNLKETVKKVIYSSAIPETNVELVKARQLGIPTITFSEAISEFTREMFTIAVCGTHGKTTVTSMSALSLIAGDKDPTVVVGSSLKEFNNDNYRLGNSEIFLVEACEYKRNFLRYHPNIIILNNLEAEHLDYYKNLDDYKSAFKEFIDKLPEDGYLIANVDDANVKSVIKDYSGNLITFGSRNTNADFVLRGNKIEKAGEFVGEFNLAVPGEFNMMNALAALVLGQILHIERETIIEALNEFTGAWRRFELIGDFNDIMVVNDYAHHPTAIENTIKATKEKYVDKRVCCIFQPHQYNRTKNFLAEFAESFREADVVIIPDIYKVRDTKEDLEAISVDDLIALIDAKDVKVYNLQTYEQIKDYLKENPDHIDIAIIMGAGDIWKLGDFLVKSS